MNHQPSNASISHVKTHLLAALNGVRINRYEYDKMGQRGDKVQTIRVPLKYGHKTRQIHEAIQISGQINLPVIAVTMSGISLDDNRNEGKKQTNYDYEYTGNEGVKRYVKPTPITISFNVSIVTTTGSDMEEIIEHYLSVFNPYIFISWKHPFVNKEIRSKVIWDGNLSTKYPSDQDSTEKIRYICDMGMTVESWVFREQDTNGGVIKTIDYNIAIEQGLDCYFDSSEDYYPSDTYTITGMPDFTGISPNCVKAGDTIIIDGHNFDHLDGIFFSPVNNTTIPTSSYNPFIAHETLSSVYPTFDAYMVSEWQTVDETRLLLTIPHELSSSEVEIGLLNSQCGIVRTSEVLTGECDEYFVTVT